MSNMTKALEYAAMGIRVFPCKPSKAPRPRNGYHAGTTDVEKIRRWWKSHPSDMIGGVCDHTFTVVDVDCGDICPDEQKAIISSVVDRLKTLKVIDETTPKVRTMSGGFHYYLASTDEFSRKINYLPSIDILANNGYVIMPDGVNYVLESGCIRPSQLKELDYETITILHEEYDDIRKEVKYHIDIAKGKKPKKPKKGNKKQQTQRDISVEDLSMYDRSEESQKDPTLTIVMEEKIHIDEGMLDTDKINALFFNQDVQRRLGAFLGLRVPKLTKAGGRQKGSLQRSILVGHSDSSPSMGVRWAKVESHILARDFSDHYGDGLCDYNVVRLYMNKMYGKNVKRPSKAEWVTWFVRMLFDAGIIDITTHLPYVDKMDDIFGDNIKKKKAAESIFLLDALKRLHSKYSGEFPVTKSFMAAWCSDVHRNTSYLALKELVRLGFLVHTSTEQLSEKKRLYLYMVNETKIEKEEDMKKESKESESIGDWLGGNGASFDDIGELDRREGDKLEWDTDAVDWDVFDADDDDLDVDEIVNRIKPPI